MPKFISLFVHHDAVAVFFLPLYRIIAHIIFFVLASSAAAEGVDGANDNHILVFENNLTQASISTNLILKNAEFVNDGSISGGLQISRHGYAVINNIDNVNASSGTLAFWVKPNWDENDESSHVLLTMRWQKNDKNYMAISQGWWEPHGKERIYFILSNTEGVACSYPGRLVPNAWSFVTAVWQAGRDGYCSLYINGKRKAHVAKPFHGEYKGENDIYIGSDLPTVSNKNRLADFVIDELMITSRTLNARQVRVLYDENVKGISNLNAEWRDWLDSAKKKAPTVYTNIKLKKRLPERRVIFDGSTRWVEDPEQVIDEVVASGFNIYIPNVWYGKGARFLTEYAPVDPSVRHIIQKGNDPLKRLIDVAHSKGVEVHAWFSVLLRFSEILPSQYAYGAPQNAFNVHSAEFNEYVIKVIVDLLTRYPLDGLNLDHIRSFGFCTSEKCEAEYNRIYNRSLKKDLLLRKIPGNTVKSLENWNVNAVSELVQKISSQARKIRPNIVMSVDAHPLNPDLLLQGQDSIRWANSGWVDIVFNMIYAEYPDINAASAAWNSLEDPSKMIMLFSLFDKVEKQNIPRSPLLVADYIRVSRMLWPGTGVAFYQLPQLNKEQIKEIKALF